VIESLEAVKSAGPGGGVDESGGGEISCGVQAGRREGRRREVSWCIGASSASAIVLPRRRRVLSGAGGLVREREK